jgi:hypothetical protein
MTFPFSHSPGFLYKYLGLTVRNLSLRRTSPTCDSESTMVCFLIGCCCKVKLLFYIDTWHSGEQVSEMFWSSVSSLEEWGIWFRLNYVFLLWDGCSDINATYLLYHFFIFFSNVGELNPGLCTCWADILPLSYFLSPKYYYYFFFTLAVLGLNSGLSACKAALYCLSHIIISNLSGLGQNPLLL